MPEISVIVPVYKVEKYLDQCVTSILDQTFKDFELILVDDGSPDRCPQMCDEWAKKDSRIYVVHKKNGGLSSARNIGIAVAQGKYVNFVDSDDWVEKDALEHLLYLIDKYNADFSYAEMVRVNSRNSVCQTDEYEESVLSQKEFLMKFFKVNTQVNVQYACAKLYRRELFSDVRYYEGITAEDVPTMFEIAVHAKTIAHSTKVVYDYYINPNSITQAKFGDKSFDLLTVWDIVCNSAKRNECERWIAELAELNRARANLGVLCNLSLSVEFKKNCDVYREQINCVRKDLKNNIDMLLKAKIPFSRKMLSVLFAYSFPVSSKIINQLSMIGKRK